MNTNKKLILIVEDEPRQAELIANYVEASGDFRTIIAHNGIEAFQALKKHRKLLGFAENEIKGIFLDIRMPDMDGMEFLQQMRKEEKLNAYHRYIPIIMITAYDTDEYLEQSTHPDLGMVADYLLKPIDKIQLRDTLSKIYDCQATEFMIENTRDQTYFMKRNRSKN